MIKTFFGSHTKKSFHVYYGEDKSQIQTYFDSQYRSSHNEKKGVETSVPKFCEIFSVFSEIFPGFLTNQNFWGALVPPCIPPPTPLSKLASKSSIETPSLPFMVLNTGTQQTRSKLACSIPVKNSQNCQTTLILQTPNACHNLKLFMHTNVDFTAV